MSTSATPAPVDYGDVQGIIRFGHGKLTRACFYALGIRDVGVVQNPWGRPEVAYSPRGEKVRRKLGIGDGHVTLTDEAGLIVAVAVLERAPKTAKKARSRMPARARKRR